MNQSMKAKLVPVWFDRADMVAIVSTGETDGGGEQGPEYIRHYWITRDETREGRPAWTLWEGDAGDNGVSVASTTSSDCRHMLGVMLRLGTLVAYGPFHSDGRERERHPDRFLASPIEQAREALEAAAAYVELFTGHGVRKQPPAWARLPGGGFDAEAIAANARAVLAAIEEERGQ